jgi:hypothetical protein
VESPFRTSRTWGTRGQDEPSFRGQEAAVPRDVVTHALERVRGDAANFVAEFVEHRWPTQAWFWLEWGPSHVTDMTRLTNWIVLMPWGLTLTAKKCDEWREHFVQL